MRKGLITLFLALFCLCAQAQRSNLFSALSPNLKLFLNAHPAALTLLSNTVTTVFADKQAQLNYYHSYNPGEPKSFYHLSNAIVVIDVCSNQSPVDEFISLFFEIQNSLNAQRVLDIVAQVRTGKMARTNYSYAMLKLEFTAMKTTRDALGIFNDPQDLTDAGLYRSFTRCPNNFEDFLRFVINVDAGYRDPIEYFERQYDSIRAYPKGVG